MIRRKIALSWKHYKDWQSYINKLSPEMLFLNNVGLLINAEETPFKLVVIIYCRQEQIKLSNEGPGLNTCSGQAANEEYAKIPIAKRF